MVKIEVRPLFLLFMQGQNKKKANGNKMTDLALRVKAYFSLPEIDL
jgi:hypothetical protein